MKTFLVVDDSKVVRKIAGQILAELKFEVLEAENGEEALKVCKQQKMPEAILLDWNMPVMSGIEFLKALRADPAGAAPIVIFCTTENDMSKIAEAITAGANEYIMKPFDAEILKSKLTHVGLL